VRVFEVLPPMVDTELRRGLDVPKIPVSTVVDSTLDGLRRDRQEIRIGRVKALAVAARIAPSICRQARRAIADATVTPVFAGPGTGPRFG
jgi:uncharacterized oxidoreductase